MSINDAPVDELALVPGIGAGRARQIVEMRERRQFRTSRDLARIPGISTEQARELGERFEF